jgi:peptidyl-prolyl cis-trans isomerase D
MISAFRSYLSTWVVRGFFLILVASFAMWGIGDVVRQIGEPTWVAKVGDRAIEVPELDAAYRQQMNQLAQTMPAGQEPPVETKRGVARQALEQLIVQAAVGQEIARLHIVVPDEALRQAVYGMPAFRGPSGQFDRRTFEAALAGKGLNEARFLDLMRGDLAQRQLVGAVRAGAVAPGILSQQAFEYQNEQRSADVVDFALAAVPPPPAPDDAAQHRWYDNHPDSYSTPEYRRIKAAILSPQTLAKDITVTDDELRASYEQHKSEYVTLAKRSVQIITAQDQAKAEALATAWRAGAAEGGSIWAAMQEKAKTEGAAAVELSDATEQEFPSPELGQAVFAAAPDTVSGPSKGSLGWYVVRVTKVVPGNDPSFDALKADLRDKLLADKAADLIYDRANKMDNILASGASIDELPSDLGLVGAAGTLDETGNTPDGAPAPIPGGDEVKAALIASVFQMHKGDPPRLQEVQLPQGHGSAYYAAVVEDVTPPALRPFDTVQARVIDDIKRDEVRKSAEQAAAKLLGAVKGGQSLADAATVAGTTVRRTAPMNRAAAASDVAPEVQRMVFGLKQGEPAMVETAEGFTVAALAQATTPDPKIDPAGYNRLRDALSRSLGDDIEMTFASALRQRAGAEINQSVLDSFVQP